MKFKFLISLETILKMMLKKLLLIIAVLQLIGCNSSKKINYEMINPRPTTKITKEKVDSLRKYIESVHPNIYMGINTVMVDSVVNQIVNDNKGKLLSDVDFTLEMRRFTDLFHYVDPHLMYFPDLQVECGFKGKFKNIMLIPLDVYNINDTLIVKKSYVKGIKRGDQLLSINGHGINEFLKYIYPNSRWINGVNMQVQSQLTFSENYNMIVNRKGKVEKITVEGINYKRSSDEIKYCAGKIIDEYKTGYYKISSFRNDKKIFNDIKKYIEDTKAKAYTNFIIDLRGNPGGNGNEFAEMFSLMSDKSSLLNMKSQFIKVSSKTKKFYKFLKEHKKGELVEFPDDLTVRNIPLKKKLYQGEMNYYVLIDKSTGSVAASFANIFQNNGIGVLVGEPLEHNSLKFGDVVSTRIYQRIIVSTVQYDEHTKSLNGILIPDIEIPYVAKEYMEDEDPILNKLLNMIKDDKVASIL